MIALATTADGGLTLTALLPSATMPENPFTLAQTTLDFTNVLGALPNVNSITSHICLSSPKDKRA